MGRTSEIIDMLKLKSGRYGDLGIAHMLIGIWWFEHFHVVLSLSSQNVPTINTGCVVFEDVNVSTWIEHPFSKWKSIIFCLELLNILGMCVVMFCGLTSELNRFNCYRYTTFLPKHRSFVSLLPLSFRFALVFLLSPSSSLAIMLPSKLRPFSIISVDWMSVVPFIKCQFSSFGVRCAHFRHHSVCIVNLSIA